MQIQYGKRVEITGIVPDWNYAVAGHPALGSIGTLKEYDSPEGKELVVFKGDAAGKLFLTDDTCYTELDDDDDDGIALFIDVDCFKYASD